MKVLFATVEGGLTGGANIASMNLMTELVRRGVEVHAAVLGGELKDALEGKGIICHEVRHIPFFKWPRIKRNDIRSLLLWPARLFAYPLWNLQSARRVARIIKEIRPDFVESCNSPAVYGYFASRKTGIPHIWHLREYLGKNVRIDIMPSNRYLMRHWLPKSYTIAVSEDVGRFFGCTDPGKDFVVTDGVFHESEAPRYIAGKEGYFLYVGLLVPTKGCDDLINAFILYAKRHPEFSLWLAGAYEEPYLNRLRDTIRASGIDENRVKFLGFRKDRYDLMAKAQATIVPSPLEAFGFITVEAIMNGSIVIGRDTGGTHAIMQDCPGCSLPFDTTEQMAARMEEVLNKGALSFRDGVAESQEHARNKYTIERCGAEVAAVYEKIKESHAES